MLTWLTISRREVPNLPFGAVARLPISSISFLQSRHWWHPQSMLHNQWEHPLLSGDQVAHFNSSLVEPCRSHTNCCHCRYLWWAQPTTTNHSETLRHFIMVCWWRSSEWLNIVSLITGYSNPLYELDNPSLDHFSLVIYCLLRSMTSQMIWSLVLLYW